MSTTELTEMSARYGLSKARGNIDKAIEIAEKKYQSLINRAISVHEWKTIRDLVQEIRSLQDGTKTDSGVTSGA